MTAFTILICALFILYVDADTYRACQRDGITKGWALMVALAVGWGVGMILVALSQLVGWLVHVTVIA